jgi:predicted CXXCH cytochrome family protein
LFARIALGALVLAAAACLCGCERGAGTRSDAVTPNVAASAVLPAATFVGGAACAGCHAEEAARWRGSHHDLAMQVAGSDTVLGDFNATRFEYAGITSTFFTRAGEYWVNTDGPDGALQDFRVTHTFGIEPLQQYLIELPDGRHQALSIAWDSRAAEQGGQRWFHLYPDEEIVSGDALHWTGAYQSWNTMCAECHSTNILKNYDPETDRFATTWSSIDVDCEACHGPGSNHVLNPMEPLALAGAPRAWVFADGARIAERIPDGSGREEIEVCAQCHARRSQLTDEYEAGQPFLDGFRPALLEPELYHADGQMRDEVYVYGSFLQSKMAAAGVTCSDCHEPHSAELRAQGNALCAQCHLPSAFATREHHHHAEDESGAECVACHMRAETYMVVDPRHDHSFRVPRPDLSLAVGSPNACNDCHRDQSAEWAAERVAGWYPERRQRESHYGQALHAGSSWAADGKVLLREAIADRELPGIVRATAIGLLATRLDDAAIDLIRTSLDDGDPLVQLAAVDALQSMPSALRADYGQRFLTHELRAVRIAAARALLAVRPELSVGRQADLDAALEEYMAVQRVNSDRGEGLLNRATALAELGNFNEAERVYRRSIEREPAFAPAYVNLADLYRTLGREPDAEQVLRTGLARNPRDAATAVALGLSLVRSGRPDEALSLFEQAAASAQESPYYAYVLGVASNSAGDRAQALRVLRESHERFPGYADTLLALATILRDGGEIEAARGYAQKLVALSPTDGAARALLTELEAAAARSN